MLLLLPLCESPVALFIALLVSCSILLLFLIFFLCYLEFIYHIFIFSSNLAIPYISLNVCVNIYVLLVCVYV